jgi:glutathione S-transferase
MSSSATSPARVRPLRLYTIPMSHYAEKARFALVRTGRAWEEERHVQGPHYLTSLRVGRTPFLPILRDGAAIVADSTAILRYLDGHVAEPYRLFPAGEVGAAVTALEDELDRELGIHVRRLVYFYTAQSPRQFLELAAQGTPRWERAFMSAIFGLARRFAFFRLGIRADEIDGSVAIVRRYFERVDAMLARGHRYLFGDRFSAADLTFACLGAPMVLPEQYGVRLPALADLPAGFRALADELRARPSGQFILKMFEAERRSVTEPPLDPG